jgi:negative regulator of sigma E activity
MKNIRNIGFNFILYFPLSGNADTGDQQLVVTMELNGTQYEGVLFANPIAPTPNDSATLTTAYKESNTKLLQPTPTKNTNNNNSIDDRQQQSQHIQRPLISS